MTTPLAVTVSLGLAVVNAHPVTVGIVSPTQPVLVNIAGKFAVAELKLYSGVIAPAALGMLLHV